MPVTDTNSLPKKIEQRLHNLDKKMNLLLEELKVYSDDQLNRRPKENKWSVMQNMHHLMLVEQASQRYLEKKLSYNPQLKNSSPLTNLRLMVLRLFLNSPFKWKAPEVVGDEHLPDYVRFWDQVKQWRDQRSSLKNYLSTLSPDLFRKEAYKHPRAGRLSIAGMLDSIEWHFDRHQKQIRKIVKPFPKQI